ncbi:MAG TPA: DUF4129 domain-containing protein [Pirellulaceae bacterium]|nr:DUF4129 domain-containing protein [Pirellulaceae bacterium]
MVSHCGLRIADCGFWPWPIPAALALFLLAGLIAPAGAQDPENPVELGREAFGKRDYPWYDASKDEARPLRMGADTETKTSSDRSDSSDSSGFGVSLFGSGLQALGLILLAFVLAAAAALIVWAFLRNETQQSAGASVVTASRDVDRVEQLPFALKRASGDFLAEAQRLAEAGNYSEAIIYLYSHLLVQLDKHHVIRLTKGKTNRQYLRETRSRPSLAGILEPAMIAFEDVFFGKHEIDRERFEECHNQVGSFQAELARLERQAA